MKKMIALALALIMTLSLGTVAMAATSETVDNYAVFKAKVEDASGPDTIVLGANITGKGVYINRDVTIDFNGHTYTTWGQVGSGTTVHNGIQIAASAAGANVVLKNGTLAAAGGVYILAQNYANLTLENMTLDMSGSTWPVCHEGDTCPGASSHNPNDPDPTYALSNCGNAAITTNIVNSTLIAREGHNALDVWPTSNSVTVNVDADSVLNGNVEVGNDGNANSATLDLDGTLNGAIKTFGTSATAYTKDATIISTTGVVNPGEKFSFSTVPGITGELTTKNYKVSEVKWTKGGALVDKVEIDNDTKTLVITLKENYTISSEKDLIGKITLKGKGTFKDEKGTLEIAENLIFVTNFVETVYGEEDVDDASEIEALNNTIYVCDEDAPGYVKFNTNALLSATLNMAGKEKAFMYTDESMIEELEEKFPDADIECYAFGGQPTFKNAAKFTLQADYADKFFLYSYTNGKLAKQEAEWDSIEGVYTWETKTPTTYVISDVELVAAAADSAADHETKNPDTGANDVVGVAAALAVVSLLAAGAVSLKK